jgi:hypothetical protein
MNIHLRGVEPALINQLKKQAAHQRTSVNTLILQLLNQSLGLTKDRQIKIYHELDKLAGTWKKQEAKSFLKNISDFEKIDEDLWK